MITTYLFTKFLEMVVGRCKNRSRGLDLIKEGGKCSRSEEAP